MDVDFLTELLEVSARRPPQSVSLSCDKSMFSCKMCSEGFMTLGAKGYIVCDTCGYNY